MILKGIILTLKVKPILKFVFLFYTPQRYKVSLPYTTKGAGRATKGCLFFTNVGIGA